MLKRPVNKFGNQIATKIPCKLTTHLVSASVMPSYNFILTNSVNSVVRCHCDELRIYEFAQTREQARKQALDKLKERFPNEKVWADSALRVKEQRLVVGEPTPRQGRKSKFEKAQRAA